MRTIFKETVERSSNQYTGRLKKLQSTCSQTGQAFEGEYWQAELGQGQTSDHTIYHRFSSAGETAGRIEYIWAAVAFLGRDDLFAQQFQPDVVLSLT